MKTCVPMERGLPHHPPKATPQSEVDKIRATELATIWAALPWNRTPRSNTNPKGMKKATKQRPNAERLVRIADAFWATRIETNRTRSIPHNFKWCRQTGRFTNFAKAGKVMEGKFEGIFFNDSDVYKVLEGASYSLQAHPDAELEKQVDEVIAWIAAAQQPNGYLNSYYTLKETDKRWTNLKDMHELYCAGHLFEGAVAHYRATGDVSQTPRPTTGDVSQTPRKGTPMGLSEERIAASEAAVRKTSPR